MTVCHLAYISCHMAHKQTNPASAKKRKSVSGTVVAVKQGHLGRSYRIAKTGKLGAAAAKFDELARSAVDFDDFTKRVCVYVAGTGQSGSGLESMVYMIPSVDADHFRDWTERSHQHYRSHIRELLTGAAALADEETIAQQVEAIWAARNEPAEVADEPAEALNNKEQIEALLAEPDANELAAAAVRPSELEQLIFDRTLELVGGSATLGSTVRSELDLLRAIVNGFPVEVVDKLKAAGFPPHVIERTVAPRRTLARRKAEKQKLTQSEADAVWRLAHVFSLASHVLSGEDAALAWLRRPKKSLGERSPMDLLQTSVGAKAVEKLLWQLEWGQVA